MFCQTPSGNDIPTHVVICGYRNRLRNQAGHDSWMPFSLQKGDRNLGSVITIVMITMAPGLSEVLAKCSLIKSSKQQSLREVVLWGYE